MTPCHLVRRPSDLINNFREAAGLDTQKSVAFYSFLYINYKYVKEIRETISFIAV